MDTSLLALPDDALLAVLGYLEPRDLLRCRPVCRRLRDLCLHADLWRSVRLWPGKGRLPAAVLLLLPCLRTLSLWDVEPVAAVVGQSACVVAELQVYVQTQAEVTPVTEIIEKIAALGGLKKLTLDFCQKSIGPVPSLLSAIYRIGSLHRLEVIAHEPLSVAWCDAEVSPCLTELSYGYAVDPFLELLLKSHAATLEDVQLYTWTRLPKALGLVTRLRSLTCHLNEDLAPCQALSNLHTLDMLSQGDMSFPSGALDLLRQSSHLRCVALRAPQERPMEPLLALAASPSAAALEKLTVRCDPSLLVPVAGALRRFPSLQSLFLCLTELVHAAQDDFFRALGPAVAPRLTSLKMRPSGPECLHAWLHGPAALDLLARNPGLHLYPLGIVELKCRCAWCCWGCHRELKSISTLRRSGFAAHATGADCPRGCFPWP